MKKIYLFSFFMFVSFSAWAQVGIGTTEPEADLHIAGELLVQDTFTIASLPSVNMADEDFKLLTRVTNSDPVGKISVMDIDYLTVAPINVVNYRFVDVRNDNLRDVNLQYDADKYVVGIANFRHVGAAVKSTEVASTRSIGTFVFRTYVDNGAWHLEIRNRDREPSWSASDIEYYVTLIVYDKSYYRNLPPIVTNLGGSNAGTASSIPNLY